MSLWTRISQFLSRSYCDILCNQIEKKLFQLKTCQNLGGAEFNIDEPERANYKIKLSYYQQLLIDLAYLGFTTSSTVLLAITTIFTKNPFFWTCDFNFVLDKQPFQTNFRHTVKKAFLWYSIIWGKHFAIYQKATKVQQAADVWQRLFQSSNRKPNENQSP